MINSGVIRFFCAIGFSTTLASAASSLLAGKFDNAHQLTSSGPDKTDLPHTTVSIEQTREAGWTLWRITVETEPGTSFEQTWAMREETQGKQSALIPYYQLHQDVAPRSESFDPSQWLSLEACALRGAAGKNGMNGFSEGEQCVAVSMGVGARRALLPVAYQLDSKTLRIDLNLRGQRAQIVATKD